MKLQERMIELRKKKGISQEELAEKIYVSRQTISNWERGKTYPDLNSLMLLSVYFDISIDYLIKGDVTMMKHQVDQSRFKKWLLICALSFFIFSIAYPTRFLMDSRGAMTLLILLICPVIYSGFQIFYILKNRQLQTYADILNFLDHKKQVKSTLGQEIGFVLGFLFFGWLIFFAGTVISTLVFW